MKEKEIKKLQDDWVLVVAGSLLAFFISVAANALYNLSISNFSWRIFCVMVIFMGLSLFLANFFWFLLDRIKEIREEHNKGFLYFLREFIRWKLEKK